MAVSDIAALDPIITGVGRPLPDKPGEYYISIATRSGEINPPAWTWSRGTIERYIYRVFTEDAGQSSARGESNNVFVRRPGSEDGVNLAIAYEVVCPRGNETRLVQTLGQNGNPTDAFKARLTAWIRQFLFGREGELFSNFDQIRSELLNFVAEKVVKDTGLRFQAALRLKLEQDLSTKQISEHVEIQFRDSHRPQRIGLICDLDIVPKLTVCAVVTYHRFPALRAELTEIAKDYFRHAVPAQAFAEAFRNSDVVNNLRQRFDEHLETYGRRVSGLTITPEGTEGLPPVVYGQRLQENVRPLGRGDPIPLTSDIQLTLENLAQFQAAQIASLSGWLERTFREVLNDVCFDKKYLDYLQRKSWPLIETAIKNGMESEAKKIGYRVKQIFSKPELKESKFAEPQLHQFVITGLPFRSTSPVHFDLAVGATFSIADWDDERMTEKINHGIDLDSDMKTELRQALSIVLARVTPNDFILKFSQDIDGPSIETKLADAVQTKLKEAYQANVSFVSVNQVDTDEIKRVREILDVPKDVDFMATPPSGEEIRFSLTWKISNIETNSWDIISRPFCNLDEIQGRLRNTLSGAFSALRYDELRYEGEDQRKKLEERASKVAVAHVETFFGLLLTTSDLRRFRTKMEELAEQLRIKVLQGKINEIGTTIDHNATMLEIRRAHELGSARRAGELTGRMQVQLLALMDKRDRTRLEDDQLAELLKALPPEQPGLLSQSTPSPGLDESSLASDPQQFSAHFFSKTDHEESGRGRETQRVEGPTIEGQARIAPAPSSNEASSETKRDAS
jgi:hypothetical protein